MQRRISRRSFLSHSLLGTAGLGTFFYGDEATGTVGGGLKAARAWRSSGLDSEAFLSERADVFANADIGFSFAPEQWRRRDRGVSEPLAALRFLVERLGMREARLSLRWDGIQRPDGRIDLSTYRPLLDYCFARGVSLCLSIGPIRTFHWPEDRVPGFVTARLGLPPHGTTIDAGAPMAQAALAYTQALIEALRREYGGALDGLSAVQAENESFQAFDRNGWQVSERYMLALLRLLDGLLPGVPLLVTSAGRPSLGAIGNLFAKLIGENESFRGRLISGFDYYYTTPNHNRLPFPRYLDPIVLAFHFPSAKTCAENIADSRLVGYRIEASEIQAEPFAAITAPGNSVRELRYALLRCAESVIDPHERSVLRVWGMEKLAMRALAGDLTPEHEQMFDLITRLTGRPVPAIKL